jgi:hypothetical protein
MLVLCLCVLIVFSLRWESLKLILVDKPLPEVVLSQRVEQAWRDERDYDYYGPFYDQPH